MGGSLPTSRPFLFTVDRVTRARLSQFLFSITSRQPDWRDGVGEWNWLGFARKPDIDGRGPLNMARRRHATCFVYG